MKLMLLMVLMSLSSEAAEPEFPWPNLSKSSAGISSSSSTESVVDESFIANMFEIEDCIPAYIDSSEHIKASISSLCDVLDLQKDGLADISVLTDNEHFLGYSMAQFFTTGLISAYFDVKNSKIYWNIFSARAYDLEKAKEFMVFCFKTKQ